MRVIYYCYGSAHSSILAAAIHLGKLPMNRVPDYTEILKLDDFDIARDDSLGHIFYKGQDDKGHEVYTLGMGPETHIVKRSLLSMIEHSSVPMNQFIFAQALPQLHPIGKVGGALSRRYGFEKIGRFLAAKGACYTYFEMVQFVKDTKQKIAQTMKSLEEC